MFIGSGLSTFAGLKSASEIINNVKKILDIKGELSFEKAISYYANANNIKKCIEFLKK